MTVSIKLFGLDGKPIGEAGLPEEFFAGKIVKSIIHDAVRAEESSARQGTHQTKTRSEVSGGGKKPWKQKGTGRARHGSTRSPIWRKGGTVFGPHPRSYDVKLNRKVKKLALTGALTARASEERIVGLEGSLEKPRAKSLAAFLKNFPEVKKPLLLHTSGDENLVLSFRNLRNASHTNWRSVSVRKVMASDFVILTKSLIAELSLPKSEARS